MKVLHVSSTEKYVGIETGLASLARHQVLCPGMEHQFALCSEGSLSQELQRVSAGSAAQAHKLCEPATRLQDLNTTLDSLIPAAPAP